MTGEQMRGFRNLMRWTTTELGEFLGLRGDASLSIHKMEAGAPISGPIQTAIELKAKIRGFHLSPQGKWEETR